MKKLFLLIVFGLLFPLLLLWGFQFDDTISTEDRLYADSLMQSCNLLVSDLKPEDFDAQLKQISEVQACVLTYMKMKKDIPMNHTRNVRDLYEMKHGLCFDLSYVMEKILRVKGYEIRHVALYHKRGRNSLSTFFSSKVRSHAICEVKTAKGWMIIDSVSPFIGLRNEKDPLDMKQINDLAISGKLNPNEFNHLHRFYTEDNLFVYGLYSRHGRFYAPYNFIPDYRFYQLFYNFI
jgi:hypothetical protein